MLEFLCEARDANPLGPTSELHPHLWMDIVNHRRGVGREEFHSEPETALTTESVGSGTLTERTHMSVLCARE